MKVRTISFVTNHSLIKVFNSEDALFPVTLQELDELDELVIGIDLPVINQHNYNEHRQAQILLLELVKLAPKDIGSLTIVFNVGSMELSYSGCLLGASGWAMLGDYIRAREQLEEVVLKVTTYSPDAQASSEDWHWSISSVNYLDTVLDTGQLILSSLDE